METCTLSCHVKIKVTLVVKSKTKIGFPPPSTSWPLLLLVAVGLFFVLRREDAPPAPRPADDDEEGEEAPEYDAHNFERRRGIGCCTGVGPGTDRGIVKIDECRHLMRTLADRIGRVGGMSAAVSAFQLAFPVVFVLIIIIRGHNVPSYHPAKTVRRRGKRRDHW